MWANSPAGHRYFGSRPEFRRYIVADARKTICMNPR